jgi:integrase
VAHIEKRGPGRWRARYRGPDGKERSRTFERRVDAQKWLDGVRGDLVRGTYVDPSEGRRTTFGDYADRWMAAQPWRPSTRDTTEAVLRRILPTFGERPIGSLRTSELQAWANALSTNLAPATVEGTVRLLAAVLKAAAVDGVIARSPAEGVRLRRREGSMLVPLSVDEVRLLAEAAPPELYAAVIVGACTGLRQGELFGLIRRELVVDRQLLTPRKGSPALGPCKTARSVRTVPVADHALEVLSRHVERCGPGEHDLVFHRDGRPWARNRAAEGFGRLARSAGVEASGWHALRHHAASILIAQGLGVTAVAATLGHSPAECLKTYAGWWPSEHEQIRAAVARAWSSPAEPVTATNVTG